MLWNENQLTALFRVSPVDFQDKNEEPILNVCLEAIYIAPRADQEYD